MNHDMTKLKSINFTAKLLLCVQFSFVSSDVCAQLCSDEFRCTCSTVEINAKCRLQTAIVIRETIIRWMCFSQMQRHGGKWLKNILLKVDIGLISLHLLRLQKCTNTSRRGVCRQRNEKGKWTTRNKNEVKIWSGADVITYYYYCSLCRMKYMFRCQNVSQSVTVSQHFLHGNCKLFNGNK